MKRTCFAVAVWLLPAAAFATPCIPGSLASYVALGAAGCNIGTAQFSDFRDLPLQGGAAALPDSATLVNPVDAGHPGFRFDVNGQAGADMLLERVIGYSLSGPGFGGNDVSLTGSDVTFDGAVTVIEHRCLGAAFGPGQFCSGVSDSPVAYDLGILGQSLIDSSTLPPRHYLASSSTSRWTEAHLVTRASDRRPRSSLPRLRRLRSQNLQR